MTLKTFIFKAKDHLWYRLVKLTHSTPIYPFIYRSYWHHLLHSKQDYAPTHDMYFAARPNPGAGIGHQMANWIAGYWWSKQLNLNFAHMPFSTSQWDDFLGFGHNEISVKELQRRGFKLRRLPHFFENDKASISFIKKIIASYNGQKVIFWPPQDHSYAAQYEVMEDLKQKFYHAPAREHEQFIYDKQSFNIAIHVRRGDIMNDPQNPNLIMRFLSNDYFEKVLKQVTENLNVDKPVHIYFFSQGKPEDYPEFAHYPNLHWCMNMNAQDSFLHMVYADLLITSKSSFSYKPALLNQGIKVCPRIFWHGYPDSSDWILVENNGTLNTASLKQAL